MLSCRYNITLWLLFFDITHPWVTRTDQNEGLNTLVKTKRGKKLQAVLRCFHPTVWHTQTLPFLSAPGYGSPWSAVCELKGHPNRSCCRWRLGLRVLLEGLLRLEDFGGWIEMVHWPVLNSCMSASNNKQCTLLETKKLHTGAGWQVFLI